MQPSKKDQINERVEKLGKLKPITINYNGKSEVIDKRKITRAYE